VTGGQRQEVPDGGGKGARRWAGRQARPLLCVLCGRPPMLVGAPTQAGMVLASQRGAAAPPAHKQQKLGGDIKSFFAPAGRKPGGSLSGDKPAPPALANEASGRGDCSGPGQAG
jgi:hypothetical protein